MKKTLLLTFILTSFIIQSQTKRLDDIINTDNSSKISFNYDAYNVNLGADLFQKNDDGIAWDKISENILTYNSDNLVSIEIFKNWNGSSFINDDKYVYFYNTDLSTDIVNEFSWSSDTNMWELTVTKEYTYNNGLIDFITEIYANDPDNNREKKQYVYSSGALTSIELYEWDSQWHSNPWQKSEFSYDGNGNIISDIEYYDFDEDGIWEDGDYQKYFTYDITVTNLIMPNINAGFIPKSYNNMITSFSTDNNTYNYYYSEVTTANIIEYKNIISIYPNPTENQITFNIKKFNNIEIYNVNGKLILKTKSNLIDMKEFTNGLYIYKINKGNKIISGKIIKQ